jgi:hypothetical protein
MSQTIRQELELGQELVQEQVLVLVLVQGLELELEL